MTGSLRNGCIRALAGIFLAAALFAPVCAYASRDAIDLEKPENYFYDAYYPDSSAAPKVIENYDLAVRAFEKKDIIKALFYLNNVLKYSQFSKEAFNLYGVALMYEGDYENARELFRKAVNQDNDYKWPYINLGVMSYKLEKWRDLEGVSSKYLAFAPEDFEANLGMGVAAFHLFCYEEADGYLKKAYDNSGKAVKRDFLKLMNDYRARVRGKIRRLY